MPRTPSSTILGSLIGLDTRAALGRPRCSGDRTATCAAGFICRQGVADQRRRLRTQSAWARVDDGYEARPSKDHPALRGPAGIARSIRKSGAYSTISSKASSTASRSASASASACASASASASSSGSSKGKSPSRQFFDDDRWQADYLESLMKKAGALTLKFTTIDADGNVHTEQGTYKKADLCKEHDLDPRDLRKLDSLQPNLVPTILSRKSAIIVNMLHVRALIKADTVILFDSTGSTESKLKYRLLWHLQGNLKARRRKEKMLQSLDGIQEEPTWESSSTDLDDKLDLGLSYEHRALESILVSVANALEEEMSTTRTSVGELLADLEEGIRRDNLKMLLHYSRSLAGFQSRVRNVLASIEEVLESDEDLSNMYLSAKMHSRPRGLQDHEELELLLESFSKQVEEIVSEVENVVANMQSTQEIAELMLDSNRNTLIAMDLKVSIATLGLGTGAVISGLFGMNLTSHIEQNDWAFYFVSGSALGAAFLVTTLGLRRLARMRRIGVTSHNPWPELAGTALAIPRPPPTRFPVNSRRWHMGLQQSAMQSRSERHSPRLDWHAARAFASASKSSQSTKGNLVLSRSPTPIVDAEPLGNATTTTTNITGAGPPNATNLSPASTPPPDPELRESPYTIPNAITSLRILSCPLLGWLIVRGDMEWACGLLAISGFSDWLDGYIARKYNMKSVFGTILDPAADKTLMTTLVISLGWSGLLPIPLAALILGRDVALSFSAFYYRYISLPEPKTFKRYWDFSIPSAEVRPTQISKYNTALQLVLMGCTTVSPIVGFDVSLSLQALQWTVAGTTIWSGLSYVGTNNAVKILRQPGRKA